MKTLILLLISVAVLYGGCQLFNYTGTAPVRNICDRYKVGAPFSAMQFDTDIKLEKTHVIGRVNHDSVSRFTPRDVMDRLKAVDAEKSQGQASATISVGFPKFTCTIDFANGVVTASSSRWWD